MDDETSKPDLTRVLPIVEERASLHSVSKPDVRDELNSLSRDGNRREALLSADSSQPTTKEMRNFR